jgi:hypothetical protein
LEPGLLDALVAYATRLRETLSRDLVGAYLYGSMVCGAHVPGSSDADLLVLHGSDLTRERRAALAAMHEGLGQDHAEASSLDVSFAPLRLVGIGGEESLPYLRHGAFRCSGGGDVNVALWHGLRERGVAVWGRPATEVVPPVTREVLDAEMLRNLAFLRRRMPKYAVSGTEATVFGVLSLCRVLYTLRTGSPIEKAEAARWAMQSVSHSWRPLLLGVLDRYENGEYSGANVLLRVRAVAFSRALVRRSSDQTA